MNASEVLSDPHQAFAKSRGWLLAGGIISLLLGIAAMAFPVLFSVAITKVLGIFAMVSGFVSLFLAIFGKHVAHRIVNALTAILRIVIGAVLLIFVFHGMVALTLLIASFLTVEGIFLIAGSIQLRKHSAWIWMLLNGIIALLLGLLLFAHWPGNSAWVLGLFYGINSIFYGTTLLTLAIAKPKTVPAAA